MQVEEQPTGSLSLGGAYSTSEGLTAQVSLTERNFLGRGQTVSATVTGGSQFGNYELGFTEPALFDRDLLAGFLLYYRNRNFNEQTFKTKSVGFEPRDRLSAQRRRSADAALPAVAGRHLRRPGRHLA